MFYCKSFRCFSRYVLLLLGFGVLPSYSYGQTEIGIATGSDHQLIEDVQGIIHSPLLSADHSVLYFAYSEHPRNQGNKKNADIWLRHRQADGSWARVLNAGSPINSAASDYPVGISADGKRLAVLRVGLTNFLDILQQGDRSWSILSSFSIAPDIKDVSFDLESQKLVYSRLVNGQRDLFERHVIAPGQWSAEQAFSSLNTALNEISPYLSFDGNSLYFQREDSWFVSRFDTSKQIYGEAKPLEEPTLKGWKSISISVTESQKIMGINSQGSLASASLSLPDQPLACKLFTGRLYLPQSPEDRLQDASLRLLVDGHERRLYPDVSGAYTIAVPEDRYAQIIAEAPGFFAPSKTLNALNEPQLPELAATNKQPVFSPSYYSRESQIRLLQKHISQSQNTLAALRQQGQELQQKIRQEQLAAGRELLDGFSDPELEALRFRLQTAQENLTDTIPPTRERIRSKITDKTAPIGFEELEAMKAIFRAQQEDKLQKKGIDGFQWQDQNPASLRREVEKVLQNSLIPELTENISRATLSQDTNKIDSIGITIEISNALFPSKAPAVYERQTWENELINELRPKAEDKLRQHLAEPVQKKLRAQQQILSTYQQEQFRLQAYQDSLQHIYAQQWAEENQTLGRQRDFSAKGLAKTAPNAFASSSAEESQLALIPLESGRTIILPQIQFSPNNNRFAPTAYQELDRLAQLLQTQEDLEIAITAHTNDQLGYLAAQELSEERAFAVLQYLTNKGIALQRLSYSGNGRQVPLVPNDSAENRAKNQRIEITIR